MCVVSPKTLIKYEELPKFNGKRIESIYAVYENSHYGKGVDNGYYVADILYFECHVHRWDCGIHYGKDRGKSILKVKDMPAEFNGLFGKIKNKGRRAFITNMWFRMEDSCNGSFTDGSIYTGGWASNSTTDSYTVFRGVDYVNSPEHIYAINVDSVLGKAWLNILGKSFKVTEVEFADCGAKMEEGSLDFACKYPYKHTPIRVIDGLVYPDEKLPSWRGFNDMPYRVPAPALNKSNEMFRSHDVKSIRVWDECFKAHVYLERADDIYEGEEGLVSVTFKREQSDIYGNKEFAYCYIHRFNESCNNVYARHTVTKMKKDGSFEYETYRNMEKLPPKYGRGTGKQGCFYRIVKISESIQNQAA